MGKLSGRGGVRRVAQVVLVVSTVALVAAACVSTAPPPQGSPAAQTVEGMTFVPATRDARYVEQAAYNDDGGLLLFRVDNPNPSSDRIEQVLVNGVPVESMPGLKWWRVWPPELGPAGSPTASAIVTIKGISAPMRGSEQVTVTVQTENGVGVSRFAKLRGSVLKVGSVVASADRTELLVTVRNRSDVAYTVDHLAVNDDVRVPVTDPSVSTPGGDWTVEPGRVLLARVQLDAPAPVMAPIAVQVGATGPLGQREWVLGALRLIEPEFDMGTWHSELPQRSDDAKRAAKQVPIDQIVGGVQAPYQELWDRWRIQTNAQRFADPAAVSAQQGNPAIRSWLLSDEPDLGDEADDTPAAVAARVDEYRTLDPTHPMWVNFAMQRRFNEYGQIPDITGHDHYVVCAPNAIFGSNWARNAEMREALDYTDVLKDNTEPLPMWIWPQLAADQAWNCQPDEWAVSTQFWLSVMGGADGYNWFVWNSDYLGDPEYARAMSQSQRDAHVVRQVRDVITYGEVEASSSADSPYISTRTIVGEERQVVVACNLRYTSDGPAWSPTYRNYPVSGNVTVDVPDWVSTSTIRRVTPTGTEAVAGSVSGQSVTLPVSLDEECAVFTIGAPDTVAPSAPAGLRRATSDTLAWAEGRDDVGVAGYLVYRDGVEVASVPSAVYVPGGDLTSAEWTVAAVDSAGNVGPRSAPAV
jgi:hypothetical protein